MNKLLKEFLNVIPVATFFIIFAWTMTIVPEVESRLMLIYGFFIGTFVWIDLIEKKHNASGVLP